MKVFVWREIENLTDQRHPEGGAVAFAESVERAMELIGRGVLSAPDLEYEVDGAIEQALLFPNSGCC